MTKELFLRCKYTSRREGISAVYYCRLEHEIQLSDPHFEENRLQYFEEERLLLLLNGRSIAISRTHWLDEGFSINKIIKSTSKYIEKKLLKHCHTSDQYYYFKQDLSDINYYTLSEGDLYSCQRIKESSYHSIMLRFWREYVPLIF